MQPSRITLTPTDVANEAYCPRLFFISKMMRDKRTATSLSMVLGSLEHETFRILAESFDTSWRNVKSVSLKEDSQDDIIRTLDHVYNLSVQSYPHFANYLKSSLPELHYRINLWIDLKEKTIKKWVRDGFTRDFTISRILPWKTEESLFNNDLGLYGRADAIYSDGRTLVPEDLKTHTNKFSTLLHHESFKAQLLCYTILVEQKYDMPSKEARIFYSRDVTYVNFKASATVKDDLITKIHYMQEKLPEGLPPVLQGEQSIKCQYCYAHRTCSEIEQKKNEGDWIDRLTSGVSGAEINPFGGDGHAN